MQEFSSIETPEQKLARLREKIWRRSHSLRSLNTFDIAVKNFEKFMNAKNFTYNDCMKSPIEILDDFSAWLDRHYASNTVINYVRHAKKVLKFLGATISADDFKERVTLPKTRPFEDDKVTKPQIRRIMIAATNLGLKVLLMLMKDTQIRPTEAVLLKVKDFDFTQNPPFVSIPAEAAKSDIPREVFFTAETRDALQGYIKAHNRTANDYVFLGHVEYEQDEMKLQRRAMIAVNDLRNSFRLLLEKPEFQDLNEVANGRRKVNRYKIHIYSFKKFAFTAMADTLGMAATRAVKGDAEYVFTYYKKSHEERAAEYMKVVPKLSIFTDETKSVREQIEDEMSKMSPEKLNKLLHLITEGQ